MSLSKPEDASIYVDKISRTFADLLKIPSLTAARFDESDHTLNIYSEWGYADVSKKERLSFVKMFTVLKSSMKVESPGEVVVVPSAPIPYDANLTIFSKSGYKKAVLTSGNSTGEEKEEILQIFSEEKLLKTYDLKELDKHKTIYNAAFWGATMTWSPDETKLAYIAEKKIPKAKPFFTSFSVLGPADANANEAETKDKNKNEGKGEEFTFRQSWGEQLNTAIDSVIVVLDFDKDEFKVLPLPDKVFPSDLQWVNSSSIIGTGYSVSDWRLGLIFCSNRESRIFQEFNSSYNPTEYLSNPGRAAYSPRVRPDSKFVIWQEREITGTHQSASQVVGSSLDQVNTKVLYPLNPRNGIPLYSDFPQNCWTHDGSKLCTVTENEVDLVFLALSFDGDELVSVSEPLRNISGILWIGKDHILAERSSYSTPSSLILLDITTKDPLIYQLSHPGPVLVEPVKRLVIPGSVSPSSFYYGPTGDNIQPGTVPLVVIPHGGPHGVYSDDFSPEMAFWLILGFGTLRMNYVGSTGGTTDTTADLLGKIGFDDVKDCQRILEYLLSIEPTINMNKIAVYGASHGGFLSAHLSSSYPETYKAAVLLNPVTDLCTMVGTTDITDWCYSEAGVKFESNNTILPTLQSLDNASKFMECSPIKHVEKVLAPTLLLLGSEDLRVPMSQGTAYYRALKAANKTAEIRVYNDCHSMYKVPVRFDCWIHATLWMIQHLNENEASSKLK